MSSPDPQNPDYTPDTSAPTDIAPLGNTRPAHTLTAEEDRNSANWDAIAADPDFIALVRAKIRFIVPATAFFVIYYFSLPVLVGWFPDLMNTDIIGKVNLAYLFALSQFLMAWALAFLYVFVAAGWDKRAATLLAKFSQK